MKRNGFMSIEMLLIIGVVVAALAGVFLMYNKITRSTASMKVTEDIASLMSGLDRYKGATGGYPMSVAAAASAIPTGANTWNAGNVYIENSIVASINYATSVNAGDVEGNAIGNVSISIPNESYTSLGRGELLDILRMKCLNGKRAAGGLPMMTQSNGICVLAANAPLFDEASAGAAGTAGAAE